MVCELLMQEQRGFFCKADVLWINRQIADLGKNVRGPNLAGPIVYRRGTEGGQLTLGLEAESGAGPGGAGMRQPTQQGDSSMARASALLDQNEAGGSG